MKKYLLLLFVGFFISCGSDDDYKTSSDIEVQDFVWNGLNMYYLWKDDVPNLADNRFSTTEDKNNFLRNYSNPSELFNNLLYERGITDRFSVIFSDYTLLEQVLTGTNKNNGVDYGLFLKPGSSNDVIGWVRYILPNSDASGKNIQRGSLFYAVNGTSLNIQNYQSLLSENDYTLNLADYNNGNFTPNGQNVTLSKHDYSENPVYYTNVYHFGSHKIGYLMYNGFYANYDVDLNNAFGNLQTQGVTDLILDLRYNSGGSVNSAVHLASMITGQFNGQIFAKQQWNSTITNFYTSNGREEELINRFTDKLTTGQSINHLNLNRVYILTTSSTASASELVINGLMPYINVIQIGGTTIGKNVGSVTLYDSKNFGKNNLNPNHKYAMQPLVLKIANKDDFGDYQSGIIPDTSISENFADIKPIGNINELFLATAISQITGISNRPAQRQTLLYQSVSDAKAMLPMKTEMYLDNIPKEIK